MSVVLRGGITAGGFLLRGGLDSLAVSTRRISSFRATGGGVNPTVAAERATWLPGLDPPPYLDGKWVPFHVFATNRKEKKKLLAYKPLFCSLLKVGWRFRVWPTWVRRGSWKLEVVCSSRACPRPFRHARCCRNTLHRCNNTTSSFWDVYIPKKEEQNG